MMVLMVQMGIYKNAHSSKLSFLKICFNNNNDNLLNLQKDDFKLKTVIEWIVDKPLKVKEYVDRYLCIDCPIIITAANEVQQTELYNLHQDEYIITMLRNAPFVVSLFKNNTNLINNNQQWSRFESLKNYTSISQIIVLLQFAIAKRIIERVSSLIKNYNKLNSNKYVDTFWNKIRKDTRIRQDHLFECFMLSYCNVFKHPENLNVQIQTKDGIIVGKFGVNGLVDGLVGHES